MTDTTDDSASAEPVDARVDEAAAPETDDLPLDLAEADPETPEEGEQEQSPDAPEDDGLIDWTDDDGKTYRVPPKVRDGLMMKADHTRKTMELAEIRKSVEMQKQRQVEFAAEIAQLGAIDARLAPYNGVQDWAMYLRTGGAEAQAHYAEFQAMKHEREAFVRQLGHKVQQQIANEQRESVELIEKGRAELAKHIKGYGPETLDKLTAFAAPFGFSPDEIRGAESDPRSIRILHLAEIGHRALEAQKKSKQLSQGQATKPIAPLRGGSGSKSPDSMNPAEMAKLLGY